MALLDLITLRSYFYADLLDVELIADLRADLTYWVFPRHMLQVKLAYATPGAKIKISQLACATH